MGIFDADALEAGVVDRTLVAVGGGPSGVVLDDARQRLYVLNRFDQTISLVEQADDPNAAHVGATVALFDPSPPEVKNGRPFNFDAHRSGHGDVACGSCHVYGDFDGLGWDLGNPYGQILPNPNLPSAPPWSPMKGPMTTQSLRGMAGAGPLHWRGDRTAASHGGSQFDVDGAFKEFNPAFVGLLGNAQQLTAAEMQTYTDWALTIRYPPNPNAQLDGTLTAQQAQGFAFFMDRGCNICHALPLGTSGASVSIGGGEGRKIPHLRNVYTKVGMFGQQPEGLFQALPFLGDQMRGFGFFHDGANAVTELAIVLLGTPAEMLALPDVNAYVMAFQTGLAPVVGQQVSANPASVADAATLARRDLLIARANADDCDLVVHGMIAGRIGGARYLGGGVFESDRVLAGLTTVNDLWNGGDAAGAEQLWTCVPPGSGSRIGIDRDEDGFRDGDEIDAGTDPADPVSHPAAVLRSIATSRLKMKDLPRRTFSFVSTGDAVVAPAAGGSVDPTMIGATLRIFNGAGSGEQVTIPLPADGWLTRRNGFIYHLHTQGISSVRIRAGRLSIRGGASAFGYTLDEPTQGSIVVRLSIGVVDYCADAVPTAATDVDSTGRFEVRHAPSPVSCPAPPGP